jgi:hypothetical protein
MRSAWGFGEAPRPFPADHRLILLNLPAVRFLDRPYYCGIPKLPI